MTLTLIAIGVFGAMLLVFIAMQLGKSKIKKDQAEKNAKESEENAKISSEPYIDNPFSRMRGKK